MTVCGPHHVAYCLRRVLGTHGEGLYVDVRRTDAVSELESLPPYQL